MTSRWPLGAFAALGAATIAAFFLVQHLKVALPLINGFPAPFPSTIDPVSGGVCTVRTHNGLRQISFRRMSISFYLQNQADTVNVYVIGPGGRRVRQIGDAVHMPLNRRHTFYWDGRLPGGAVAPDGAYAIQVQLIAQGRTFEIANQGTGALQPVTIDTSIPRPVVTGVSPATIPLAGGRVTIRYAGVTAGGRGQRILIYRL
ncbi:MAG: FlgD immunoglobulin-like domain containing protein, partial [Solirubrobacteraceae bacterium]